MMLLLNCFAHFMKLNFCKSPLKGELNYFHSCRWLEKTTEQLLGQSALLLSQVFGKFVSEMCSITLMGVIMFCVMVYEQGRVSWSPLLLTWRKKFQLIVIQVLAQIINRAIAQNIKLPRTWLPRIFQPKWRNFSSGCFFAPFVTLPHLITRRRGVRGTCSFLFAGNAREMNENRKYLMESPVLV